MLDWVVTLKGAHAFSVLIFRMNSVIIIDEHGFADKKKEKNEVHGFKTYNNIA